MDLYLTAVLAGEVDLEAAVAWLESDSDTCAPGANGLLRSRNAAGKASAWGPKPSTRFSPAQLRAYVLDHVREQAAPVLEAGRQHRQHAVAAPVSSAAEARQGDLATGAAAPAVAASRKGMAHLGRGDAVDFPPLPQSSRRIVPTPVPPRMPVAAPAGARWASTAGIASGSTGYGGLAPVITPSRHGSQPSTPLGAAAARASPFAATPPPPQPDTPEPAPATSPSLERLMSGARRSSPAVNGSVKVRAATQLQFDASGPWPQHAAAAADFSPKASPTKQRQAQHQVPRPAGSSLNARLGRTPGAHSGSDKHAGQVNGRIAGGGSAPAQRQPRRINPQQLQQPAAPAPPALRPGLGSWPSPAVQSLVPSRAGNAAWPQPSAGLLPAGPSCAVLSAAGSLRTAHSINATSAAANPAAAAAAAEAAGDAGADSVQSSAPPSTTGRTAAQASATTSAAAPEALDEAECLRRAGRLGTLYGQPLRGCSSVALAPELDLLLHLLALPAGLQVGAGALRPVLLNSTAAAAAFASAALLQTGHLLMALGCDVLAALAAAPAVKRHATQLQGQIQDVLSSLEWTSPSDPVINAGVSRVMGLSMLAADTRASRTAAEHRLVNNREKVRDAWLDIIRVAADAANPYASSDPTTLAVTFAAGGSADPGLEQMAAVLREQAPQLLLQLLPENFASFAQIFTAALLQTAVTGVVLVEAELAGFAQRSLAKFQGLESRFTGARGGRGGRSTAKAATQEAAASTATDVQLAMLFPLAQRPYILFLHAADSYRLNRHLLSVMAARLQALAREGCCSDVALWRAQAAHTLLQTTALARFLSYLGFAFAEGDGDVGPGNLSQHHPVDVLAAVAAADSGPARLATLPWVAAYLTFLPRHPAAAASPYFRSLAQHIAALRTAPALQPASLSFGPAALCLRCSLDEALCRLPPPTAGQRQHPSAGGTGQQAGLASQLAAADVLLDGRFLELACPPLHSCRMQLQAANGGGGGAGGIAAVAPPALLAPSASAAASLVPGDRCAAPASAQPDAATVRLQEAFLTQYSPEHAQVGLRAIVTLTSEAVAANLVAAAAPTCLTAAAAAAQAALAAAAEQLPQQPPGIATASLLRQTAERLAAGHSRQAVEAMRPGSEARAKLAARRALAALAGPQLPDAAVATAAAIVLERALVAYEQRLLSQVEQQLHRLLFQQVSTLEAVLRKAQAAVLGAAAEAQPASA